MRISNFIWKSAGVNSSSQAKCPILAYSNLPLGVIHVRSESSNQHALSFASTNEIVEEFGNFVFLKKFERERNSYRSADSNPQPSG